MGGGQGSRLGGVRKGDIRLDNIPLAQHAVDRMAPVTDVILYAIAARSTPPALPDSVTVLADDPEGLKGPVAALQSAALWCEAEFPHAILYSASVDSPLVPMDFVERASPLLDSDCGCVSAAFAGRRYPTSALWNAEKLAHHLATIPPSPKGPRLTDIQQALGAKAIDYAEFCDQNPFAGINTLPDLLHFERLIQPAPRR